MPGLRLMQALSRWAGYRDTLPKAERQDFDYLTRELAARREETLVHHPDPHQAMQMNILLEIHKQLKMLRQRVADLENKLNGDGPKK